MNYIESRLLQYFVAVAEELHFSRAAERLGITPPTLTEQIQKLESQLGVRLLRRKGNTQVVVTEAGQRVLARAREILRQVEETAVLAQQAGRGELGRLELGFVTPVSNAGLLRTWTDAFREANPAIDLSIQKLVPMAQISAIQRGELDAGFMRAPHKYPTGVRGFQVYRQPLALALPSQHPLARHKAITPAMLASEAFISIPPQLEVGFFGYTEAIADIGNFTARVVRRENDFTPVLGYVALGYGIAVVPALTKTTTVSNVVYRDIAADPVPHTSIAFVYGSDPSPPAKVLIRHMQRHALHNRGKDAAPHHNHDRIIIPSAPNLEPHAEVRATLLRSLRRALEGLSPQKRGARGRKRASKDEAAALGPRPSRLSAPRRAPQGEEMSQR